MPMAFRRGGFALTPPSIWIFAISLIPAIIAILIRYAGVRVPIIGPARVSTCSPSPICCCSRACCSGEFDRHPVDKMRT
jgi:hypothetical protein